MGNQSNRSTIRANGVLPDYDQVADELINPENLHEDEVEFGARASMYREYAGF